MVFMTGNGFNNMPSSISSPLLLDVSSEEELELLLLVLLLKEEESESELLEESE